MSKRTPKLLLDDILASATKILTYTEGQTFEQFEVDDKTVDAVIRNFEIIGEAANRLSEEFRNQHTSVDWHRIRVFVTGWPMIIWESTMRSSGKSWKITYLN